VLVHVLVENSNNFILERVVVKLILCVYYESLRWPTPKATNTWTEIVEILNFVYIDRCIKVRKKIFALFSADYGEIYLFFIIFFEKNAW
jgi:hypothetical protein